MRFKQCYCILAFLLRALTSTTTWPLTGSSPPSSGACRFPPSERESRVYSSNRSQAYTYFLSTVFLIALRMLLVFSCLPCLGTGSHALHVSSERIVINMAASPLTSAVAVELLSIVIISVGVKCKRASRVRSLGKEVPNFLPETRCPITTLLINLW
jgi:hypothetical protein